jgi:RES domain
VVESQSRSSTRVLVDSLDDHALLEQMLEESKPAAPEGADRLHYLLWTPFRYPPLEHGSRFATRTEGGLWYGSEGLVTAFAEFAYYQFYFLEGPVQPLGPLTRRVSVFQAQVRTERGVDLTRAPFVAFRSSLSSPSRYADSQALGAAMRADGVQACRFHSARDRCGGTNVVAFTPKAFARKKPGPLQTWNCFATRTSVELTRDDVSGPTVHSFPRLDFLVDGLLPRPAA